MNLPVSLLARLGQGRQKQTPVLIIHKDGLAGVTAIHDVIKRSRIFNSKLASHPAQRSCASPQISHIANAIY
jgi:hypothetical protein